MKNDDEIQLLEELANILERQIELTRHDCFEESEKLIGQSEQLAVNITAAGLLDKPQYNGWRKRLTGLYKDMELVLSTQKRAVAQQLSVIDKGKKTLAVYRDNIPR
jgi:hypothetical protein